MKLSDYKALTFDVYGTLLDWEGGMIDGLKTLTDRVSRDLTRDEILEAHAFYESTSQRYTPAKKYHELLPTVYRRLAEEWGVEVTWEQCVAYGEHARHWKAFDDTVEALQYLKKHYKLVVLTNTDNTTFAAANTRLGVHFDGVYTAEDVGSYKPFDRNFDYMIEMLARQGIQKHEILHTAESMFHDHAPANKFGLANCWIYRRHDKKGFGATMHPGEMPKYDFQFNSMIDMAKAHQAELAE
ncbi:haloacid dehalogenase type II [Ruegeria sp. HKCCA6837]|uniref:haloacid dehalogenase type II n=1 Tax=Ruegeria sp. HKCCA6837 TaxID=2682989 RepID=UPI001489A8CB|nr:haloacid dehalogenase type II [Ruegeria sp. HKCCA6837]